MGSKTNTYHMIMLKKYITREPGEEVVRTSNQHDTTTAVAKLIHQDTDPELGRYETASGLSSERRFPDIKVGDDLSEDHLCMLKDLILRHPNVFTVMPGEIDVIQHRVNLIADTPMNRKPYPLPYATREELRNEGDGIGLLMMGVV